jgi:hypothetical protein
VNKLAERILKILIGVLVIFICLSVVIRIYQKEFSEEPKTYASFEHSLYKISNECIANYYADDLTTDGFIFSFYPILPECNAEYITESVVKIYDEDEMQQAKVKAYKLHGLMLEVGANGCFMNQVVLRRLDNDNFVQDVSEKMREKHPEDDKSGDV